MNTYYYVSAQYSGIQKTVLRHDRLWSMAGVSALLSRLNEIVLPGIVKHYKKKGAITIVAGGGKFTARFNDEQEANDAREKIIKAISILFPMLEFQVSQVVPGAELAQAKNKLNNDNIKTPGIINELNDIKKQFRGYALSFTPHLQMCDECGEFPAVRNNKFCNKIEKTLCRHCMSAFSSARIDLKRLCSMSSANSKKQNNTGNVGMTTIKKIYLAYINGLLSEHAENKVTIHTLLDLFNQDRINIPHNFEDLFSTFKSGSSMETNRDIESKEPDDNRRMATWFSDINNMNAKVPIWLSQPEEDIKKTFDYVRDSFIEITASALVLTFPLPKEGFLPFRIIVAGGDDLCVVMDEAYILDFTQNLSLSLLKKQTEMENVTDLSPAKEGISGENTSPYLSMAWLKKRKDELKFDKDLKPYSFGGSFVVCHHKSPFKTIHHVGEELMSDAKKDTDRWANSVNWRIMADENTVTDDTYSFDKPLFIHKDLPDEMEKNLKTQWDYRLTFQDYMDMLDTYSKGETRISGSHIQDVVRFIAEAKHDMGRFEKKLKSMCAVRTLKSYGAILTDPRFREKSDPQNNLSQERIMTLMELLTVKD